MARGGNGTGGTRAADRAAVPEALDVRPGRLVRLGHGAFARSEEIVAIEPIRDGRGPGRRTRVWVRGLNEPLVASRSEEALVRDLTRPFGTVEREAKVRRLAGRVSEAAARIPPVFLPLLKEETGEDFRVLASELQENVG